ncbi:hypothetical protein RMSM_04298 [Rhodopirellula maiorica SM1]|uniref:Uncharacterized protein n=1 Tax=Rhodopirellula maiorica SM1 TaxID=1265738 RepID=M5RHL6_9BACT|nr:hypothetical protein RMSM_04298 [Rhodopirellula maiorica SM1]
MSSKRIGTRTPSPSEIDEPIVRIKKRINDLGVTSKARRSFEQGQISDTDELVRLSKAELNERWGDRHWNLYSETTRILEGLGYDISDRSRW